MTPRSRSQHAILCKITPIACEHSRNHISSQILFKLGGTIGWVNISVKFDNGPCGPRNGPVAGQNITWQIFTHEHSRSHISSRILFKLGGIIIWVNILVEFDNGPCSPKIGPLVTRNRIWQLAREHSRDHISTRILFKLDGIIV